MGLLSIVVKEAAKRSMVKTLGEAAANVAATTTVAMKKYKDSHEENKYSIVPFSSDSYNLRNYKDVVEELSAYGFTNIALIQKKDLIKGWLIKDGEVESIIINGKEKFRKNAKFLSDVRVVITYHTFKNKK